MISKLIIILSVLLASNSSFHIKDPFVFALKTWRYIIQEDLPIPLFSKEYQAFLESEKHKNKRKKEKEKNELEEKKAKEKLREEREKNPLLKLVNKEQSLSPDFVPEDLTIPDVSFPFSEDIPKKYLHKEAAFALEALFESATQEGIELFAISGYRSFETQKNIYENNIRVFGKEITDRVSAPPGHSEHQTGLAMDISIPKLGFRLVEQFGNTPEGKWLQEHAHEFGFILRYPKGKEEITGYRYEPWHVRYVGKEAANEIFTQNITLEEYLETD